MFKKLAITVVVLIAGLLAFAVTRPDTFRVERSATMKAPPEKVFALINDFHRWSDWSPWEKLDPSMKRTFSGPVAGPGTVYEWSGSSKVGAGRMEVTQSTPGSRVAIKLDFIEPFEGHNVTEFALEPNADSTRVTWTMAGPTPFISKLMGIFVSMDTMIGTDFETGLANLKSAAEK